MTIRIFAASMIAAALTILPAAAMAQDPDAERRIAAQRSGIDVLKSMDGAWRGTAWRLQPSGEKREFIQTERIGPFLDGSIKVIEGRGYMPDGKIVFNAFGIVSYSPTTKAYYMRSYAMGHSGDFPFLPTPDGYTWSHPAGPNAQVRYMATIKDGTLHEVGDLVAEGKPPQRVFEMTLKRIGDSDWPAGGAIGPR